MQTKLQRTLIPFKHRYEKKLHELKYIFFELTHRCNLECLHCGSDCVKETGVKDLPAEKIIETLEEIKSKYDSKKITVVLSGGEPLVYKGLWKLGRAIYDLEFPWGMVSNGMAWDKDAVKNAHKAGLHSITISLDGLEKSHNWLRGNPRSFKRAVNAISMLVQNPFWRAMDVITCVNQRNIGELDDIYDLVVGLGLKKWRFTIIEPIGRAALNRELILTAEQFAHLCDKIVEFRERNEINVTYADSGYLGCEFENKIRNREFFCMAGINVGGVMVNGDILSCPNISRAFKQGNIFEDSFVDVWENKFELYRDRNWKKRGICKDCPEWSLCEGGPMHLWEPDGENIKLCHYQLLQKGKKDQL